MYSNAFGRTFFLMKLKFIQKIRVVLHKTFSEADKNSEICAVFRFNPFRSMRKFTFLTKSTKDSLR